MRSIDRFRWNVQYTQRVLATDPISYWVGDEKRGSVAYDLVSGRVAGAQNGAITGVTLGQPGIGDGRTSGQFDGATDYIDISAIAGAFNGNEGAATCWSRVANSGVWTDGVNRYIMRLAVDGNNRINIRLPTGANTVAGQYVAGGVSKNINAGLSTLLFFQATITWSASLDEVRFFINGVQQGLLNGLGVWAGNLNATTTVLGALSTLPANVWNGFLNHAAIWDYARSPAEVASLYQESF